MKLYEELIEERAREIIDSKDYHILSIILEKYDTLVKKGSPLEGDKQIPFWDICCCHTEDKEEENNEL